MSEEPANKGTDAVDAAKTEADKEAQKEAQREAEEKQKQRFETFFGVALALFAAVLAVNDLAGGKYGDDELKMTSEKTSAYLWYQSKGIKESLAEGQRDTLEALLASGAIDKDHKGALEKTVTDLGKKLERYEAEKKEILAGSKGVGPEGQVLDVDGEKGKVVGVKEMEKELETLGSAGDRFDTATLFLQLCVVFGALGILVQRKALKRAFFIAMVVGGVLGAAASITGFVKVGIF